jgi:hypothetical protein
MFSIYQIYFEEFLYFAVRIGFEPMAIELLVLGYQLSDYI